MKIIWGIIGCGDVVKRLVKNSFFIKNVSCVNTVMSLDINEAKIFFQKNIILKILQTT